MENVIVNLPMFAAYQPAILGLAVLCLFALVQSFLAGMLSFRYGDETPGALSGRHDDLGFRVLRTFQNSVENLPIIIGAAIVAIAAGVDDIWVNWLVWLNVFFRMIFWGVYYAGVGKVSGGLRTLVHVLGWTMCFILTVMAIYALVA